MKQHNSLFVGLILVGTALASTARAGDFERDVNAAISNLSADEPSAARDAYKAALETYRDARNKTFECLLAQVKNADPGRNINSDWDACVGGLGSALAALNDTLPRAYKEAHPDGDYSPDKIGLKDFMNAENVFVSTLGQQHFVPEARAAILFGLKTAQEALKDFDQRWEQLSKPASELLSQQAGEENTIVENLKKVREAYLRLDEMVPGSVDYIAYIMQASQHTDAFWAAVQTQKASVFAVFRGARETAQKVYDERIRPEVSEGFLKNAQNASDSTVALTNREDYQTFAKAAFSVLADYVKDERGMSEEFLKRNKGKFVDTVESEVIERLAGGAKMNQYLQDMNLEAKTLEELLVKHEGEVAGSSTTDEVKDWWRKLKDSVVTAGIYNRWVQGYADYQKSLDENGLKR